jgi:hypothetical protein
MCRSTQWWWPEKIPAPGLALSVYPADDLSLHVFRAVWSQATLSCMVWLSECGTFVCVRRQDLYAAEAGQVVASLLPTTAKEERPDCLSRALAHKKLAVGTRL